MKTYRADFGHAPGVGVLGEGREEDGDLGLDDGEEAGFPGGETQPRGCGCGET